MRCRVAISSILDRGGGRESNPPGISRPLAGLKACPTLALLQACDQRGLVGVLEEGVSEEEALPAEEQAAAHRTEDATRGKQGFVDQARADDRLVSIVVPSAHLRGGLNSTSRQDASRGFKDASTHPTGPAG